jgi:hypothetical protein
MSSHKKPSLNINISETCFQLKLVETEPAIFGGRLAFREQNVNKYVTLSNKGNVK